MYIDICDICTGRKVNSAGQNINTRVCIDMCTQELYKQVTGIYNIPIPGLCIYVPFNPAGHHLSIPSHVSLVHGMQAKNQFVCQWPKIDP